MNHLVMDSKTGKVLRQQPVDRNATLWKHDPEQNTWIKKTNHSFKPGK